MRYRQIATLQIRHIQEVGVRNANVRGSLPIQSFDPFFHFNPAHTEIG
jgi:hypothetical protein